ncbi:MAG: hypothetical protein KatS3mg043_1811 [Rhodothermaceae bacterium]|nr:MAG: hypothetical protein KatS3mg043_1811 [Rhodothermaceae bacterium]
MTARPSLLAIGLSLMLLAGCRATRPDTAPAPPEETTLSKIPAGAHGTVPAKDAPRSRFGSGLQGLVLGALAGTLTSFGVLLFGDSHEKARLGVSTLIPAGGAIGFVAGLVLGGRRTETDGPAPPLPVIPDTLHVQAPLPPAADTVAVDPRPLPTLPIGPPASDTVRAALPDTAAAPAAITADTVRTPAPEPRTREDLPPRRGWTIVVASLRDRDTAVQVAGRYRTLLQPHGLEAGVLESQVNGVVHFRVIVGSFTSLQAATSARRRLANVLPPSAWLLRY